MSEALSSSEIEDVLSSIRRLVSDDLRPVAKGAQATSEPEKLLLTPALRVVQSVPPAQPASVLAIDEVVASVSARVDAQGDDWEAETGDHGLEAVDSGAGQGWMLPEELLQDEAEVGQAEAAFAAETAALLGRVAEPLAIVDEDSDDPELETPHFVAHPRRVEAAGLPGWAQTAEHEGEDGPRDEPWIGGALEPDRAWADEAEAAVLEELAAPVGGAMPEASYPSDADEFLHNTSEQEIPFSEEVLREIVRDVLREELQGRLGERITRNIRKLVRAEIARVMATDEFL
jgi:hypothetical protein